MGTFKGQILIAGYFGRRNAGDESILQGMLAPLRKKCTDASFVVVSADPDQTMRYHSVRSIHWSGTAGLMDEVERSALVIVGGGGLFHDYWGFDETNFLSDHQGGISEFGSPLIWAHLHSIPCMLYGVGVGPLQHDASRNAVRELFEFADDVVVRDEYSKQTLEEIGFDISHVRVSSDPAFSAPHSSIESIMPGIGDVPRPLVGVSIRPWTFSGSQKRWESEIADALARFLETQAGTILFVPMQDSEAEMENDVLVCERIRDLIHAPDRVLPIDRTIEPIHRICIFESCDLVLGMRLHSLVGAIRGGVPCVALSYDLKIEALMEEVDLLDNRIPLDEIESSIVYEKLTAALEHGEKVRRRLKQKSKKFAASADAIAEQALALLEHNHPQSGFHPHLIPRLYRDSFVQLDKVVDELVGLQRHLQDTEGRLEAITSTYEERSRMYHSRLDEAEKVHNQLKDSLSHAEHELLRTEKAGKKISDRLEKTLAQLKMAEEDHQMVRAELGRVEQKLQQAKMQIKELQDRIRTVEEEKADVVANERQIWESYSLEQHEWGEVKASKGWRMLNAMWSIVWRMRAWFQRYFKVPLKCLRFLKDLAKKLYSRACRLLPIWLRGHILSLHLHRYEIVDKSKVILYIDNEDLFPGYQPRASLSHGTHRHVDFSLIVTVVNEAETVESWMKALERQSRTPNEIVIVDGGSIDGTIEIIKRYIKTSSLNIRIYTEDGINIARGRNIAVEQAEFDVIVVADFGSDLSEEYLAKIVRPFELQPETQVVAGWFEPMVKTQFGKWIQNELVPRLCEVDPQSFLPSARSMAFHRSAWREVGEYPEWLTLTGDDTYFALELKRSCRLWAFVPEALVFWHAPETLLGFWRKLVTWSKGDGESGVYSKRYFRFVILTTSVTLFALLVCGILITIFYYPNPLVVGIISIALLISWHVFSASLSPHFRKKAASLFTYLGQLARAIGFIQGVKRRPQVTLRRYAEVEGVVFVLTGIPIDDTGGGSRGAQIARQFLERNYLVVYLYKFPKAEHEDLQLSIWHPRLIHGAVSDMDWKAFSWQYGELMVQKQILTLVEFPLKDFLPYIDSLKECGGKVVYDLIDDWNSSLGGTWYSQEVEQSICYKSDLLIATAQQLACNLETRSKREVHLIPNAVNLDLFDRRKKHERPEDLPHGDLQLIYIGALWGEWFDWGLMEQLAERFPQAAITVIGDYDGDAKIHSGNVHFLGLKGQDELPSYLIHSDVAVIPWKNIPLTQATSPLKVYEYLAMGVPVVAPDIEPLEDIPYVFCASTHGEFLDAIQLARNIRIDVDRLDEFIHKNTWAARVNWLIENTGFL